jgi:hypothetical protein
MNSAEVEAVRTWHPVIGVAERSAVVILAVGRVEASAAG